MAGTTTGGTYAQPCGGRLEPADQRTRRGDRVALAGSLVIAASVLLALPGVGWRIPALLVACVGVVGHIVTAMGVGLSAVRRCDGHTRVDIAMFVASGVAYGVLFFGLHWHIKDATTGAMAAGVVGRLVAAVVEASRPRRKPR